MKVFLTFLVILLLAGLGYGGWLYVQQTDELDQTRVTLSSLNNNLLSLQGELTTEQAKAAGIQTQLATEKNRAAVLEGELVTVRGQQNASASQITSLKAELEASKAKITSLENELTATQTLISGTQKEVAAEMSKLTAEISKLNGDLSKAKADLAKASLDISGLKSANATQLADLNKVKDPRHFYTIEELRAWLERDDTNTNPSFASMGLAEKAFILQVRALRDGYLLPAAVDADSEHIYSWNVAVIGASIYVVTAGTDETLFLANFEVPPAQRPLPLS